jgi:hypothetical protein
MVLMSDTNIKRCAICGHGFNRLSNHVRRTHDMDYEDYLIKHEHGGVRPICACGRCGLPAPFTSSQGQGFKKYIHGHHAYVRVKSDDEKRRMGQKNSENMKRYWEDHPEEAAAQAHVLRSGLTPEIEARRIQSTIAANKTPEKRVAVTRSMEERWKSGDMDEPKKRANETLREGYASGRLIVPEERRDRISAVITQKYLDGGFEWSRGAHTSTKTGKTVRYRSSWELRHMQHLDSDPAVVWWDYEPEIIRYEHGGRTRRYLPDFIVRFADGHRELQEVGVKTIKESPGKNAAKMEAALRWCLARPDTQFRLITFFPPLALPAQAST